LKQVKKPEKEKTEFSEETLANFCHLLSEALTLTLCKTGAGQQVLTAAMINVGDKVKVQLQQNDYTEMIKVEVKNKVQASLQERVKIEVWDGIKKVLPGIIEIKVREEVEIATQKVHHRIQTLLQEIGCVEGMDIELKKAMVSHLAQNEKLINERINLLIDANDTRLQEMIKQRVDLLFDQLQITNKIVEYINKKEKSGM